MKISTVNNDLYYRVPVNKMAAITIAKNNTPLLDKKIICVHTDGVLPTIKPQDFNQYQQLKKVIGKKFGYFRVIGLAPKEISSSNKCMFVVRCDCGCYETRSSKSINNPKNQNDRCGKCRYILELRRMEEYRNTGRNRD